MSAGDQGWNLYVDTLNKEPTSAQQLHSFVKEQPTLDNITYKAARDTFNNNKGKGHIGSNDATENNENKTEVSIEDNINPALTTYLKMKKIGMPIPSIIHKMKMDGKSKDVIAQFSAAIGNDTAPTPAPAPVHTNDKQNDSLAKYDKMRKIGMPPTAIGHKMKMDGFNQEDIDAYLNSNPGPNWESKVESKLDDDMLAEIEKDVQKKKKKEHLIVERIESKERFEERIKTGRHKLEQDTAQVKPLLALTNNILSLDMLDSIRQSFDNLAPFSEETLLMAWFNSPQECEKILLQLCEKILKYPIDKNEYEWFNKYVMQSSVWMFECNKEKDKKHMFYYLLDIAEEYCREIIQLMDEMYKSLENEPGWKELILIENQKLIQRQDDEKVGLLKEKTILLCQERIRAINKNEVEQEQLSNFIDSQLAINILISSAKKLNNEFQKYMKDTMSKNGLFCEAAVKSFDRCQSKVQNSEAEFPKAASLTDLIRCSVTFNTVLEMIEGYNCLMDHIKNNENNILEIAEIKNDFLNDKMGGYKDISFNVVFHSAENKNVSMIGEIKFILNNYLSEKKKLSKLYAILREKHYFEGVAGIDNSIENLKQIYNFESDFKESHSYKSWTEQAYVNSKLKVLAIYFYGRNIIFIDLRNKKRFATTLAPKCYNGHCCWFNYQKQTYFAAQMQSENSIEIYKVIYRKSKNKKLMATLILKKEKALTISAGQKEINFFQFDSKDNIIMVVNRNELQKRSLDEVSKISSEMKLEEPVSVSCMKQLTVSKNGKYLVLAGGYGKNYFYAVDLNQKYQRKITSNVLTDTFGPCFINARFSSSSSIAIGDMQGNIEIWNISSHSEKRKKLIQEFEGGWITGMDSIGNMLGAVCYRNKQFKIWNTKNWEVLFTESIQMKPRRINFSSNKKYLTLCGEDGERCSVWKLN